MEYNLRQIQSKYDLADPVQKTEFAREAAGMLAGLDSPVEREVYAGQVSDLTGIGKPALLQEIGRARNSKLWAAKKKQTRRDMTPVTQVQPKERELRYENPRSARAEEGILRLLMLDGSLIRETVGLSREQFSSEHLGKIYDVLRSRLLEGRAIQFGMLEGELDRSEIELLARILGKPVTLENGSKAMADYRAILEAEQLKRQVSEEADLLAVRDRLRQKKSI